VATIFTIKKGLFLGKTYDDKLLGSVIADRHGVIYLELNVYDTDNSFAVDPKWLTKWLITQY